MKVKENKTEITLILHRENEDREQIARRLTNEVPELCSKGDVHIELIYDPSDENRVVDFVVIPIDSPLAKQGKGRA